MVTEANLDLYSPNIHTHMHIYTYTQFNTCKYLPLRAQMINLGENFEMKIKHYKKEIIMVSGICKV